MSKWISKSMVLLLLGLLAFDANAQARHVEVDAVHIWLNTIGLEDRVEGEPIIVFESGLGTPMNNWDWIIGEVAELAPVVTYDRPGIGNSEASDEMPTIENVGKRLISLLDLIDAKPPYILVGHSLGGLYVRGFANLYPEKLAGLVIIDPADFTETGEHRKAYFKGLGLSLPQIDSINQSFFDKRNIGRSDMPEAIQREGEVLNRYRLDDFKQISSKGLPNIPVHIITGSRFDMPESRRSALYDSEKYFRTKMRNRTARWIDVVQSVQNGRFFYSAKAGHFVHIDDPALVISSIRIALKDYKLLQR